MNEKENDIKTLEAAWVRAKAEEDRAKNSRLALEQLILESIGYEEGDTTFKNWKDDIKITFTKKIEVDIEKLKEQFKPETFFKDNFPFRLKIEVDAKKMDATRLAYPDYFDEKLAPALTEKWNKPSFSVITKEQ